MNITVTMASETVITVLICHYLNVTDKKSGNVNFISVVCDNNLTSVFVDETRFVM